MDVDTAGRDAQDPTSVETSVSDPATAQDLAAPTETATVGGSDLDLDPAPTAADTGSEPLAHGTAHYSLHQLKVSSLAGLAADLDDMAVAASDLILALPAEGAMVLVEPEELIEAAEHLGGICVAASPEPLASPEIARQAEHAVAHAVGYPVLRCHPFPYALLGPAGPLRVMLSDLSPAGGDADRLTETVLSGRHDVVLDSDSQLFHILDGTGTDVTIVAGRAHAGSERPLVLIDLSPDGHGLTVNHGDLEDGGARDLGRLLRYDGAIAWGDDVTNPAPEVLVTPLWNADFCRTVIKAAEAASMWTDDFDDPNAGLGVWLDDISPRLFTLLKQDLDRRIAPLLRNHWPAAPDNGVHGALILRHQARGLAESPVAYRDVSQLSGSVRLNDGYEGGTLVFPRQEWDDAGVPVGALTVWPSLVTHPYHAASLTRGVKYRLVIWWRLPAS